MNIGISTFKRISAKASKAPRSYLQGKAVFPWTWFLEKSEVDLEDANMMEAGP